MNIRVLKTLEKLGYACATVGALSAFSKQQACIPNAEALAKLHNVTSNPAVMLYNPTDYFKRALAQQAKGTPRMQPTTLRIGLEKGNSEKAHMLRQFKVDKNQTRWLDTDGDNAADHIIAPRSQWPGGQVIIDLKRNQFVNLNSQNAKSNQVVKPLFPWLNSTSCPKGMVPRKGFTE